MALIGKIREHTGWAIGLVAIGLGLFIVGGDILSPNSVLMGGNKNTVGKISGEDIPVAKFEQELNELRYSYYLNTDKTPGEEEMQQFLPQAWSQLIYKIAFQKEYDELGLLVSKEEQIDMVQGRNIHPAVFQSFRNPQTGQFDVALVRNYLANLGRMEAKQQAMWVQFEKKLAPDRLRTKYENLLKKSVFVTTAEAKREHQTQNSTVDIRYLFIPYSSVQDNEVALVEDDIKEYADKNKPMFYTEPTANVEYVAFPIIPSKSDSLNFAEDLANTKSEYLKAEDDSAFVSANTENEGLPQWVNPGQLAKELQDLPSLSAPEVYGPFATAGGQRIYKITKIENDTNFSARASHILFKWDSPSDEDKKKALDKAKEVLMKIKKGESFEEMARIHGTDGTASTGGDLGWFNKGRMVPEFEKAVFSAKSKGLLNEPIETQFGYHLIKITEPKTGKRYYMSYVEKNLTAGDQTRDSVYAKAENLSVESQDLAGVNAYIAKNPTIQKQIAVIAPQSTALNNLQNPKEVIRWAFSDAKVGELSSVFEIDNNFVVCGLNTIYKKGEVNIESNRQQIYFNLLNKKKADKIREKVGKSTSIDEISKKLAAAAVVNTSMSVSLSSPALRESPFEPETIGAAFGLPETKSSGLIEGNQGMTIVQTVKKHPAPEIGDYSFYKKQLINILGNRGEYNINNAITEKADIVDTRYRFY